jgi:hypothetical protein
MKRNIRDLSLPASQEMAERGKPNIKGQILARPVVLTSLDSPQERGTSVIARLASQRPEDGLAPAPFCFSFDTYRVSNCERTLQLRL